MISPTRLLEAPLPQLLAEVGAELVDSRITDAAFTGAAVVADGRVLLSMPPGRPEWERDAVARALLGDVLRVPLPPLPSPYTLTEL
ncbi:hypothetical protein [Streptomyces himalayensis]|uniref:Uncharacterized protein n=1 Tax=Streptomyces himalayensis subsp. himalayensis TaxID=2756131 RepID=A0A7W0IDD3_9ACTN|nr:hypothetical protein [Streptomyces himalayensis]MBA2951618.1 hypothetical protein [Streptomyces himalayensis subsp. himalayensis]